MDMVIEENIVKKQMYLARLLFSSRYRNSIRGHMKNVVQELLKQYLRVETQFQQGSIRC